MDMSSLPAVDATSREVMLTGALERDLVQSVEPQGIALVFVTPLADADADYEYERLMRQLREQPELWERREDLARRIRNAVSAECARVLEEDSAAGPDAPESWRSIEQWVDSREFSEARGCPRLSSRLFAGLAERAPSLHAQIAAVLLAGDAEGEAWEDDLLLSSVLRGVYGVRNGRAVAAAVYCHGHVPVEEEEASDGGSEAPRSPLLGASPSVQGTSSGRTTPSPRSLGASSSERDDAVSDDDDTQDECGEEPSGGAPEPLALACLEALLAGADDTDDDEDSAEEERCEPRLECLRARELAFVRAMRDKLSECGVRYCREEFRGMHFRVDDWYAALAADPAQSRHAFWELCRGLGLPLFLASTLQQLHVCGMHGARSLREEIGAVEHWLQQGARSAPSREEGRGQ
jgi:hypothetical protein